MLSPAGPALWSVPSDLEPWPAVCFIPVAAAPANDIRGIICCQPSRLHTVLQGMAVTSSSVPSFARLRTISL